jgi:hypothetical protein
MYKMLKQFNQYYDHCPRLVSYHESQTTKHIDSPAVHYSLIFWVRLQSIFEKQNKKISFMTSVNIIIIVLSTKETWRLADKLLRQLLMMI